MRPKNGSSLHSGANMGNRREHRGRAEVVASLLLGAFFLIGCSSTTGPPVAPTSQPYRTGPPDELVITILPDPIIERTVVVRPDGMISIDLIGDLPASGRTTEEIAADIERRISRFKRNAKVTVALAQSRSAQVTVLGEVGQPSTFALERDTRVVEALGQVGGPTIFAAKSRIKVIRFQDGKTNIFRVNLSAMEDGDLQTNVLLVGGDLVVVPPTVSASIGHFLGNLFYPIQRVIGLGSRTTTNIYTGGAY
jgi:polysaccharide export outer membrane protein